MGCIRLVRAYCLGLLLISSSVANAQTWSEWFSQKKTQQKYLLEQLAALKVYAGYLKKGYQIGNSGLSFIKGASKGEFDLHDNFFSSLKTVSPLIKNDIKVAEIIQMQLMIVKAVNSFSNVNDLGEANSAYAMLVSDNLLRECLADLEELLLLISSGKLEMDAAHRKARVEQVHKSMEQKKIFALHFVRSVKELSRSRQQEKVELKNMEGLYENR